jgi:diguanylate cyclase (GGDEF)-like protein
MTSQSQRRFVRLKTRQGARIVSPSGASLDCTIHNFSLFGLALQLADPARHADVFEVGVPVDVAFSGTGTYDGRSFQARGGVVHLSEAEVGVSLKDMSNEFFLALLEYRANLYRRKGSAKPDDLDPIDFNTIRLQCLSLYRPFVSRLMRAFHELGMARIAEEQGGEADSGGPSRNLDALRVVGEHLAEIRKHVAQSALLRVEQAGAKQPVADGALGIALMEEDEVEDWLNLSAVISKLGNSLKDHLSYFERLYYLLDSLEGDQSVGEVFFHYNLGQASPFGPDALCRSFRDALRELPLDVSQRAYLYRLFGQVVVKLGDAFYESLTWLAIVAEDEISRVASRRRANDDLAATTSVSQSVSGGGTPSSNAGAASAEAMGYSLDRTLAALNASGLMAPGHAQAAPATEWEPVSTSGVAALESSLIRTTGMLQQVVNRLAQQVPSFQAPYALSSLDSRTDLPEASTNEILLALDGLIQSRQASRPDSWQPSLTDQLRARLIQAGGSNTRIAPQQQQLLDALASLFDRVMGEYATSSEIEGLLRRFEPTFFRLALKDPEFLTADTHPARRVINILDQFAIATDDAGVFFDAKLPQVLTALVDNIIAKADLEPDVYARAIPVLEKMLQPLQKVRRQRVGNLQQSSEGKHRILQSRVRVATELESRLGGRKVPRLLLRLLDGGWRQYLSMLELREGMGSESWAASLDALDRIQTWLAPDFEPGEDYAVQVANLVRHLGQGLGTVSIDPVQLEDLLQDLDTLLKGCLRDPRPKVDHVTLEPGRIMRGHEEDGEAPPDDGKLREQLVLGWWWNIALEGDKPTPLQLIWLSQPPGSCAFANRSATRKHEYSIADLNRMKESGKAELATDKEAPLLERSESALVDEVYRHLSHQSTHEPVTNLINRKTLLQRMDRKAGQSGQEGQQHVLIVLEFDQLRVIAHQHGSEARGALLRRLAAEIGQRMRKDDLLAALGEESFAAFLPATELEEGHRVVADILSWLRSYRHAHGEDLFSVGANVGLAAFRAGEMAAEEVLRHADEACMRAKDMGRNQVQVYRSDDEAIHGQRDLMAWAGRIDKILDRDGLCLRCQRVSPIHETSALHPYYEILLGVRGPDGGEMGPQPFVQAMERSNRAHELDRWVVENTFRWIRANADIFAGIGGFSINLSAQSLNNEELLGFLHEELSRQDIPAQKIMFEITETGTIDSYAAAQEFIQQIRRYGCRFCIDDFGSGYASYSHLKNLRTDTLKIDGTFIKEMLQDPADIAMVRSMNEIGHSLGMHVVAEFVATDEILQVLREIGVDYAQGYALHKPMPISGLAAIPTD